MLLAVVVVAMFLPWATYETLFDDERGVSVGEGSTLMLVSLVGIGLIQLGWRPAWITAGLVAAVTLKSTIDLLGRDNASPGFGLWIALIAGIGAAALLIVEMFGAIERAPDDADE